MVCTLCFILGRVLWGFFSFLFSVGGHSLSLYTLSHDECMMVYTESGGSRRVYLRLFPLFFLGPKGAVSDQWTEGRCTDLYEFR